LDRKNGNNVLIITCMKDEGPFILEWVAYHKSIGVSDIIVITNDCTDGTDLILDRLDQMGVVRHLPNPIMLKLADAPIQHTAIAYAQLTKEFRQSDWVLIIDADEYVNINVGDGSIAALIEASGNADAISLNQVAFGSNGQIEFQDQPTLGLFTKRFKFEQPPHRNFPKMFGIKTLARNDPATFRRHANHRPIPTVAGRRSIRWVDGSGSPLPPEFLSTLPRGHRSATGSHALGYINHYAVRSAQSFIVQSFRGDAVNAAVRRNFDYWRQYDRNEIIDQTIGKKALAADQLKRQLLSDETLQTLHFKAVQLHTERFTTCLRTPELRDLYDALVNNITERKAS
jgi:Glycosyl transferase family 2